MQSRLLIIISACATVAVITGASSTNRVAVPQPQPNPAPVAVAAGVATTAAVAGPGSAENSRAAAVQSAVTALAPNVSRLSNGDALEMAFRAYFSFKAAHPEQVRKPYLYFVDYGLDNHTPRGYVFDMDNLTLVEGPFAVAHGRGSSRGEGVPVRFSNRSGGATTSLGLYVTQESYGFSGHAGGQLYHSIGLRLNGVSGEFNSAARARGVVMHGAPYVTPARAGRSEGCPAVEQARAHRLIPQLANGSLVFLYSPNDGAWLHGDPWANANN